MNCKQCEIELQAYPLKCETCGEGLCDSCHKTLKGECSACSDKKIPEVWRRSWLTLYDKCPYALYKTAICGLESKGSVWSVVGNLLHDLFEDASNKKIKLEQDVLMERYTNELNSFKKDEPEMFVEAQRVVKSNIFETMLARGKSSIESYIEYELSAPAPSATEVKYFLELDGCKRISATIDRVNPIFAEDGSKTDDVEIVDYKTGKCFYGKQLSADLQVPIYILAYQQTTGVLPKRFKFLFVDEGKERTFEQVDPDKYVCKVINKEYTISLQETARHIKTIFARVKQGSFGIPDNINSFFCQNFCDVQKAGQCAGKDEQSWLNIRKSMA